jgi:NAD(P) transhydrogenase subunit beta
VNAAPLALAALPDLLPALIEAAYMLAAGLFIFSLHWMSDPKTARRGVLAGVLAMVVAVLSTWAKPEVSRHLWVLLPIIAAIVPGLWLANVPLTAVPQRTALSHAFGGLAAGLVGTAKYLYWFHHDPGALTSFRTGAIIFEVLLGFLTFTGSIIAAAKLQEVKWIPQRPWVYKGQRAVNLIAFGAALILGALVILRPDSPHSLWLFAGVVFLALNFGWMLVMPIGGADMPTVIAILNAYAGLAAVAMGFVLDNKLLVTAGALDGSSGLILSIIMCKAMNRSFSNVLFGAFGQASAQTAAGEQKQYKPESPEDAAMVMSEASLVVIVPGYGMAVAQAQHKVRELYDVLRKRGVDVAFAIHPVAGRMPGHMNVLLAEAEIPYTDLVEMEEINPDMAQCDVCLVIGANDVVNPAARADKSSPIFGMPIIDADKARAVYAIKRSKNPGFAGIDNELYFLDKTRMIFGDAKAVVGELARHLSGASH